MMEIKPVVFKIGNEEYGVDISIVQGIEKVLPVVPMHNVNRNIKGIINLRGEVIPLYSLRRKFGLPEAAYTDDTKFVIAQEGDLKIAIEVDSVGEIQTIEEKNVFPFGEEADAVFNTTLVYELSVLKTYAEPLLYAVDESDKNFKDVVRLLNLLKLVLPTSSENIPRDSIIREFIGNSIFK